MTHKNDLRTSQYADCNEPYEKKFGKELSKKFKNTFKFCDRDTNKFCLMLQKGIYPYKYMDGWERFNEMLLPRKNVTAT